MWSGKKGVLIKYACAFSDVEASYKAFSLAWHRLDLKELRVQLTYRVSLKHMVSYASGNFRFVGLIQL